MNPLLSPLLLAAALVLALMAVAWLLGLWRRDVSLVDVFWGLAFVVAAWSYRFEGPAAEPRHLLLLALVTVWGLRLAGYILWRGWGEEEDRRYRAMRERAGEPFWWQSLFKVFLLQGALVLVISSPLLVVEASPGRAPLWLGSDVLGLALWGVGFFFEAVGDAQMARFKADPGNRGKVMDRGLWRFTRHPNYFGDACQWWGFGCFALAAPGGVWTFASVALMTFLLLKVSGVALLEQDIAGRRPGYRDYARRTNAFFPWFPKPRGGA